MPEDARPSGIQPPDRGPAGPAGATGATGATGKGLTKREKWFAISLLILLLVGVAACLLSQYIQQKSYEQQFTTAQARAAAAQKAQGALIEAKLCSSLKPLEGLASLKPPAGNPADNPSRAYEQHLSAKLASLAQLGPDIGCRP